MEKGDDGRCIFPLTSLQIGDLQSYFADLSLFLVNDSKKMYILVDNRPWLLSDLGSRGVHIWQLMVTKSRLSPFAYSKARRERKEGKEICPQSSSSKPKKFMRWFPLIEAVMLSRKKVLLPVKNLRNSLQLSSELHRTLYGFIVFEVAWAGVRGINYYNELQTDTSLAIEAKLMKRWEFDSIAQAAGCMSSWFSGTPSEQLLLKEHLDSASGDIFYDASEDFSGTVSVDDGDDNICRILTVEDSLGTNVGVYTDDTEETTDMLHAPPPSGPNKRRKLMNSFSAGVEVDSYSTAEIDNSLDYSQTSSCVSDDTVETTQDDTLETTQDDIVETTQDDTVEATQYSDVLLSFRFDDHDLPFKFREVIVSDLRLLTLLEAGLPSWVIFLQSYPVLCNLYRPWMCPLARLLYFLISFVTVLIGFYDLYKNVPVLKATASRLCGPLLDWIETWEMVSRVKYLGTMLFLHNFQKAVRWFLAFTHTMRSFFSILVQPLVESLVEIFGFLLPSLKFLFELAESIFSVIWLVVDTSFDIVGNVLELLFSPLWFVLNVVWSIATCILYPLFWVLWELLYAPVRLVLVIFSFVASISSYICNTLGNTWQFVSSIFQFAASSEATVSVSEVSMWQRTLWNDLFSQIFRALKSILYGFAAFFTACNRHRLSIYNHVQEFIQGLYRTCQRSREDDSRDSGKTCLPLNLAEEKKNV
ncbi:hypothetical protein AAZX31_20G051200 [Glycine max]|uniref:Uncharacterized protein n=1 Tax=Glycine max TaxID=3847 RepID=K7N1T2_SOYBN|nr:uncharacterized protein LOC100810409 [Glycine max]XP_006605652.1 uncharacterized protein LOC100810409 [Glycine max]XP_014628537.1 uncharacterized protein LOC100810409 [Glycine max]KAG5076760.1 hypothetical protein JHK82_055455 [Glycine max]KAH1034742.1 hypothetical protein GYH30_054932 [Glycine max]KRG89935.1 hypothetical protein GLYMA_20G056800v4 [Glycine max]|eukprot:XP_006605651.1 uncharacterized protein LOC100810409 [Glycine max]